MILAILRAQLLSMRLRVGTRRASAVFSAGTGLIFYGFWAFLAWGGMLFFSQPENAPHMVDALSSGLLFVLLYWQLAPVISASFGASLDLKKLLAYPIPHSKLFLVEVLLRITTCAEMLLVVGGATIGLLRNPLYGAHTALYTLGGSLLFCTMNILLSAGNRNLLERLFLRSRMKEIMLLLLVLISLGPQILTALNVRKEMVLKLVPNQLVWPWAAVARYMLRDSVLPALGFMIFYFVLAYVYSRWQFQRSLRYDGATTRRQDREANPDGMTQRFFALPGRFFPDPIGALCEKELRTLTRIPRFRLVYAMSCFFGIVLYLPQLRHPNPHSFFQQNALPLMALYGLLMLGQITYWNAFGFDRSAVQGYFSWPIRFRDALVAKNLTTGLLLIPQVFLISTFSYAVHLPISPAKILETTVVTLIAALYWFALGNICSVRLPRAMDPEKMNQMSNKMQALSIWTAPFLLLPIGLAYWARSVFHNELIFAGIILLAAVLGGIFYYVGLDSAVNTANTRREKLIVALSQSDGPLSIA